MMKMPLNLGLLSKGLGWVSGPGESFFDKLYSGLAFVRLELGFPVYFFVRNTLLCKRFEAQRSKTEATRAVFS